MWCCYFSCNWHPNSCSAYSDLHWNRIPRNCYSNLFHNFCSYWPFFPNKFFRLSKKKIFFSIKLFFNFIAQLYVINSSKKYFFISFKFLQLFIFFFQFLVIECNYFSSLSKWNCFCRFYFNFLRKHGIKNYDTTKKWAWMKYNFIYLIHLLWDFFSTKFVCSGIQKNNKTSLRKRDSLPWEYTFKQLSNNFFCGFLKSI